ncbi:hypothetical protein [Lapidilactobacillus wuchangensis]|uniref:hypothetical protein n=1 Tax=Lapidilactobacillus wuchangensis TaxID=2486001 RepID=UPI000F7B3A7F|nr:hypothetical protein [Lapidilactobacillus wuchangensis]
MHYLFVAFNSRKYRWFRLIILLSLTGAIFLANYYQMRQLRTQTVKNLTIECQQLEKRILSDGTLSPPQKLDLIEISETAGTQLGALNFQKTALYLKKQRQKIQLAERYYQKYGNWELIESRQSSLDKKWQRQYLNQHQLIPEDQLATTVYPNGIFALFRTLTQPVFLILLLFTLLVPLVLQLRSPSFTLIRLNAASTWHLIRQLVLLMTGQILLDLGFVFGVVALLTKIVGQPSLFTKDRSSWHYPLVDHTFLDQRLLWLLFVLVLLVMLIMVLLIVSQVKSWPPMLTSLMLIGLVGILLLTADQPSLQVGVNPFSWLYQWPF